MLLCTVCCRTTSAALVDTTGRCVACEKKGETYGSRQARLTAIFRRVAPKNWKDPIKKTVTARTEKEREEISEAIVHFTGSVPSFVPIGKGRYLVLAAGYYAAIGA